MKKLTDRQLEVVRLIYESQKIRGIAPTLFELAEKLNVSSPQTVKDLLDAVVRKGYLERKPRRSRAIMLKQRAIREVERHDFLNRKQLNLGLAFTQSPDSFQWLDSTRVIINQGAPSNELEQTLMDSSSLIPLADGSGAKIGDYENLQLVADKSGFDKLLSTTIASLPPDHPYLVVSPIMPSIVDKTGYLWVEGESPYQIVWSGVNSGHYYYFGKEYGETTNVCIIDDASEQMKLFSSSMNADGMSSVLSNFRKELRSWSQYVDFPIYGAALKETGEVTYWSRKTARDINDLRYFFLVDREI